MKFNLKKFFTILLSCGHISSYKACPCCLARRVVPIRYLDVKRKKKDIRTTEENA